MRRELSSCATSPSPSACASCEPWNWCGLPSIRIAPLSGLIIPIRIFTKVLLPAPFSPQMARISPASIENETLCSARAPV